MEAILDKIATPIAVTGPNHKLYLVENWETVKPLVHKWSCNRDPDMERVKEIKAHIEAGGHIPLLLHVAALPDEGLVCYDGNHRREAMNMLSGAAPKVILDVLFGATKKQVFVEFTNLNKSVQVPAMFIEEDPEPNQELHLLQVRTQITNLVRSYETKYKGYLSTSARYHAPRFNRDAFIDNVYEIWKDLNGVATVSELDDLLQLLNQKYALGELCKPHENYKPHVVSKCAEGGLWLFLDRRIPTEHVRKLFNNPFA